jgi:hypothetical protein
MLLAAAESAAHAEKLSMVLTGAEAIAHAEKQTMAMRTSQADVSLLQYTMTPLLASKDSWCDVIAGCVVDDNHNGTDLQSEGVTATKKDIIVGWDLSGLPTGATVTAASLTMNLKTAATVGVGVNLALIAAANEGWNETTVRCSTIPASDGNTAHTIQNIRTDVLGDQTEDLSSVARTRIGTRMGVGAFSMRLSLVSAAATNAVFESKDEGTNNALGPRLTLTFTVSA